jgi:hypothetical protein
MKIDDLKANKQDTLEEKTKQNEDAVKVKVEGSEVGVDGDNFVINNELWSWNPNIFVSTSP